MSFLKRFPRWGITLGFAIIFSLLFLTALYVDGVVNPMHPAAKLPEEIQILQSVKPPTTWYILPSTAAIQSDSPENSHNVTADANVDIDSNDGADSNVSSVSNHDSDSNVNNASNLRAGSNHNRGSDSGFESASDIDSGLGSDPRSNADLSASSESTDDSGSNTDNNVSLSSAFGADAESNIDHSINTGAGAGAGTGQFPLFADDGAIGNKNVVLFENMAYMNRNYGLINVKENNEEIKAYVGDTSTKFTYTPTDDLNWSGIAFLWGKDDWGREKDAWDKGGLELTKYTKLTFWVYGRGGMVKFYIEGIRSEPKKIAEGKSAEGTEEKTYQESIFISLKEEWRKVTLKVGDWDYINVPFGWSCNPKDLDASNGTATFWVDGLQFE